MWEMSVLFVFTFVAHCCQLYTAAKKRVMFVNSVYIMSNPSIRNELVVWHHCLVYTIDNILRDIQPALCAFSEECTYIEIGHINQYSRLPGTLMWVERLCACLMRPFRWPSQHRCCFACCQEFPSLGAEYSLGARSVPWHNSHGN